jgi:hypothetical protein
VVYEGSAQKVEQQIQGRNRKPSSSQGDSDNSPQPRLL